LAEKEYEKSLDRLYSKLPKTVSKGKRFEIPKPLSSISGSRTFISNFKQLCTVMGRDQQHLLKFLAKEMATAGTIEGEQAIFQGKFDENLIKHLIDNYAQQYVMCPVCHSPDTKIVKEERFRFLVCEACGAKSSVRVV
jgi:translation initiation factor 2 subunit 2